MARTNPRNRRSLEPQNISDEQATLIIIADAPSVYAPREELDEYQKMIDELPNSEDKEWTQESLDNVLRNRSQLISKHGPRVMHRRDGSTYICC